MGWLIALVGLTIKLFFDMITAFICLICAIVQTIGERKNENKRFETNNR